MKITIVPIQIEDNDANKVTSEKVFKDRTIRDSKGNILFNEAGIFSPKIFGRFGHCLCGKLRKPGYCEECGYRVLNKKKMPIFYTEFSFDLPNLYIEADQVVVDLLNYRGFLYNGEYVEFDLKNKLSGYDEDKILYGKEAVLSLGYSEEWYNQNVHNKVAIPHTSYRNIIITADNYILGDLNDIYVDLIKINKKYSDLLKENKLGKVSEINLKNKACSNLNDLYDEFYRLLAKANRSIIDTELKGQPQTGMIRAVLTNNFGLDEDTIVLGSYFAPTLYPYLCEKCSVNGELDIAKLNKILAQKKYYVLFNRQPTIGAKSIMAMKPVFSDKNTEQFVIQANPIVYDGLAADVDGDALNVIALYTKKACKEAERFLPSVNYIEGSNGSIRNGILPELKYIEDKENVRKQE